MPGVLAKAYFVNRMTGDAFAVQYNPTELSVKKSVPWSAAETKQGAPPPTGIDANIPKQDFKKGEAVAISLKLEYDTSGLPGQAAQNAQDVRDVGNFKKLMELTWAVTHSGSKRTQPPLIDFGWGAGFSNKLGSKFDAFVGVIKSVNINYTRFNPDGTPTRASVQVEMVEVKPGDSAYANHGGSASASSQTFEEPLERDARLAAGR